MAGFEGFVPERWVTIPGYMAYLRHSCDVFFHRMTKACHAGLAGLWCWLTVWFATRRGGSSCSCLGHVGCGVWKVT